MVLTPAVIAREVWRVVRLPAVSAGSSGLSALAGTSLFGMVMSFAAGLLALRWLSHWLEKGHWSWFGVYCLLAACVVLKVG